MTILNRDDAQTILKKVLGFSKAEGCEANLNGTDGGNVRFARNTVTTSGANSDMTLGVQSNYGKRAATATVNEFDDASLAKVVERSEALAKLAPENPEYMDIQGPQQYVEGAGWAPGTASIDPSMRAKAAGASIGPSRDKELVAAGFWNDGAAFQAMANSKGLFAYYRGTNASFSVTVRSQDGTGSGWAQGDSFDAARVDAGAISGIAIDKAIRSREPKAIEPGKYTVVLEPAAVSGLLQFMFFGFDARQADEGRSFLTKKGGGNRMGEKIVDERVTIYSDPLDPDVPTAPWDNEGTPLKKTMWIEGGVVKNMFYSRYWAKQKNLPAVPFPPNGIMVGGTASTDDLVKDTKRGILVTRTWYIRMVDPQTVLVTGLTRDGTYFIEDGKISFPVKNLRFNESPVIMLNNIEAMGKSVRVQDGNTGGSNMIPALRLRDFTFTSLSDAV